ncbi:MAG: Smr/MutS family protein [Bacteroidales bacterium]|nr:Smr/MutS family protein [Bacteroidales bacterium]
MTSDKLEAKLGFDKVRQIIAGKCKTDYATERVAEEKFSTSRSTILKRLQLTEEMRLILLFEENFPTTGYIDGLPFLAPLEHEGSSIDVLGLGKLKTILDTTRRITAFFGGIKDGIYPGLKSLSAPISTFPEVLRRIETIIDRYGDIKDSASPELFDIRKRLRDKEGAISRRATAILKQAQEAGLVEADAAVNIRDGKYLIPVATASKRKLPGFVYDESATGKTTFVEPAEIIEIENEISELLFSQTREIARILRDFTAFLRPYLPEVMASATFLGELDFLMAKAQTALDFIAGVPVVSEDGGVGLRKARHPLLERALHKEGKAIVPLTITLTPAKRILLISGPNAGGKSVCLKTVGLLQYMFQWGMLIPTSETSELPVFNRICVSIGDDQSLENDLSTYSSFLSDMRQMLSEADEHTLVLIDEFGAGTEPAAGGAIAEAILAEIDRRGVWGVITTHYTNLKLYAAGAQTRVVNGAMLYDSSKIAPMFALEIGLPGNSFAFELARKMRLPETIVKDAEARAGEEFVGIEKNLRKIARNRRQLDERLQKIKHTDKTLEGITERYQQELEDIRAQRKDILEEARKEAEEIVRGAGAQVEKTIRVIKESQADKEQTKAARAELQGFIGALEARKSREQKQRDEYIDRKISKLEARKAKSAGGKAPEPKPRVEALKVGEKVRVKSNGLVGEVTRVSGKNVTIAVGHISSTMKADGLERISAGEFRELSRKAFAPAVQRVDASISSRKLNFSPELDIRGQRLSDALDIVTHYVDDAIMLGMGQVRIIHGKGTGVLHEEIQKYLRTIPGIASVSDEDVRIGGSGVTIVRFE